MSLLSWLWWRAALIRSARTALTVALPYAGVVYFADIAWANVASAVGFGIIASLVTSLAGLTEATGGQVSWWYAILSRVTKTFAQALAAGIGTAVLLSDVDWSTVLQASVLSAAGSLLLGFLTSLPEAPALPSPVTPVAPVETVIQLGGKGVTYEQPGMVETLDGQVHVGVLPVVEDFEPPRASM